MYCEAKACTGGSLAKRLQLKLISTVDTKDVVGDHIEQLVCHCRALTANGKSLPGCHALTPLKMEEDFEQR